ncbi:MULTISPECIES: hypothetical protein [Flammeovirga]|uniref:Uncharacterized protein n=1 Tax=Flammeovirga agarivorans TaxID=2726742 RepID=A0A7X8SHA0_9BACT|nr:MULTISPECIES: hypothetical protein [Flammeovirga]NLR90098.1 hypothetical protein [Flammeovirga agarivorans]
MNIKNLKDELIDTFKTFKDSEVIFSSEEGRLIVPQNEEEALSLQNDGYKAYFKEDLKQELGTDGLGLFY